MKVALVCTFPARACFVTVDNGFGLATVKQEGTKLAACVIQAMVSCPFYFPPKKITCS